VLCGVEGRPGGGGGCGSQYLGGGKEGPVASSQWEEGSERETQARSQLDDI
jgi:hypothetical protein